MLNEILNGKRSITADFAILVEAALGTPADPVSQKRICNSDRDKRCGIFVFLPLSF